MFSSILAIGDRRTIGDRRSLCVFLLFSAAIMCSRVSVSCFGGPSCL